MEAVFSKTEHLFIKSEQSRKKALFVQAWHKACLQNHTTNSTKEVTQMIEVVKKGLKNIETFLEDRQQQIEEAYVNNEDSIAVSMHLKIEPAKDGQSGYQVETSVNFVLSRVSDKRRINVDPNQLELFEENPE